MNLILIDPAVGAVTPIDINPNDIRGVCRLLDCDTLDFAHLPTRDMVAVDDVGLLEPRGRRAFFLNGLYGGWLVGRALVMGCGPSGSTTAPRLSIEQLQSAIDFGDAPA